MDPKSQSHVGPEGLDFVLAYILGDLTDDQRHEFEVLLASGDPDLIDSYQRALATFAELPFVLNPKTPPPFVKDKVMLRVHEDAEQFVFDRTLLEEGVVVEEPTGYRHPSSIISKVLNLVPGYGNRAEWMPVIRFNPRRSLGFASLIFGGLFASAYGYTAVSHILQKARQQEEAKVELVKNSKVFQKEYGYHQSQPLPTLTEHIGTEVSINTVDANLKSEPSLAPVSENIGGTMVTGGPSKVEGINSEIKPKHQAASPAPSSTNTDKIGVDMNLVDAQFYFTNDPTAIHFTMRPVNGLTAGLGKIYWNDAHADALFTVSDLTPTNTDTHYVLYFTMDDGSMERVRTFQVASSAQMSFFLSRAPGAHVTGAKLVMESAINSGQPTATTVLTAANRVQASN